MSGSINIICIAPQVFMSAFAAEPIVLVKMGKFELAFSWKYSMGGD